MEGFALYIHGVCLQVMKDARLSTFSFGLSLTMPFSSPSAIPVDTTPSSVISFGLSLTMPFSSPSAIPVDTNPSSVIVYKSVIQSVIGS
jgi:hypothetical protein